MLPIQFVYTENGEEKSSLEEQKRRLEIAEHNQKLTKDYPVYLKNNGRNKK